MTYQRTDGQSNTSKCDWVLKSVSFHDYILNTIVSHSGSDGCWDALLADYQQLPLHGARFPIFTLRHTKLWPLGRWIVSYVLEFLLCTFFPWLWCVSCTTSYLLPDRSRHFSHWEDESFAECVNSRHWYRTDRRPLYTGDGSRDAWHWISLRHWTF